MLWSNEKINQITFRSKPKFSWSNFLGADLLPSATRKPPPYRLALQRSLAAVSGWLHWIASFQPPRGQHVTASREKNHFKKFQDVTNLLQLLYVLCLERKRHQFLKNVGVIIDRVKKVVWHQYRNCATQHLNSSFLLLPMKGCWKHFWISEHYFVYNCLNKKIEQKNVVNLVSVIPCFRLGQHQRTRPKKKCSNEASPYFHLFPTEILTGRICLTKQKYKVIQTATDLGTWQNHAPPRHLTTPHSLGRWWWRYCPPSLWLPHWAAPCLSQWWRFQCLKRNASVSWERLGEACHPVVCFEWWKVTFFCSNYIIYYNILLNVFESCY